MNVDADGTVRVAFESVNKVVKAELHYTTETGLRTKRKWESSACTILEGRAIAKGLPQDANTWIITLIDNRGAMVSTEVGFR